MIWISAAAFAALSKVIGTLGRDKGAGVGRRTPAVARHKGKTRAAVVMGEAAHRNRHAQSLNGAPRISSRAAHALSTVIKIIRTLSGNGHTGLRVGAKSKARVQRSTSTAVVVGEATRRNAHALLFHVAPRVASWAFALATTVNCVRTLNRN